MEGGVWNIRGTASAQCHRSPNPLVPLKEGLTEAVAQTLPLLLLWAADDRDSSSMLLTWAHAPYWLSESPRDHLATAD
jgi:hypothetical protein